MSEQAPQGFYRDQNGDLQKDRRKKPDRRRSADRFDDDRRCYNRRSTDRDFMNREHKEMIEDALADFAEEHGEV